MTSRTVACLTLLVASTAAIPHTAAAEDDPPVLVVAFAGSLHEPLAEAPERLTELLADVIRESGHDVTVAPLGDVLALAGCAEPSDDCLSQALSLLQVEAVILGEVSAGTDNDVAIELKVIAADAEPRTREVLVTGSTTASLEPAFRAEAQAFWTDEPSPGESARAEAALNQPPDDDNAGADLTAAGPADDARFSASQVEPYAWAMAGGGAGLMVVGGMLLVAADRKQDQVNDAPTDTVEDFEALKRLETSGRRYARWGSTLLVAGAVATAVGVVFVYRTGRRAGASPEVIAGESTVTVSPALSGDSVGLSFTVRGWR